MTVDQSEYKTIVLTGPITIYEAAAVRETMRIAIADGKDIRIDLSDSGPWDLAGLQLLVSCVKTVHGRDQRARLVNVPKICVDIAERTGLSDWLRSVQD